MAFVPDAEKDPIAAFRVNLEGTVNLAGALGERHPQARLVYIGSAEVYGKQHISGAVSIPLAEMGTRKAELPDDRDAPIVTVCNRGNLSISGMLFLQSLGYRDVRSLNGGTVAWAEKSLPTN